MSGEHASSLRGEVHSPSTTRKSRPAAVLLPGGLDLSFHLLPIRGLYCPADADGGQGPEGSEDRLWKAHNSEWGAGAGRQTPDFSRLARFCPFHQKKEERGFSVQYFGKVAVHPEPKIYY